MGGVSLVLPDLTGGGAERVFLTLADGFADAGVETEIVVANAEGPLREQIPPRVSLHDLAQPRVAFAAVGLARYARTKRPDVLLSALTHMNVVTVFAARAVRTPARVVVTEHQHMGIGWAAGEHARDRLLPRLARLAYRHADEVVAVSREMARDLEARLKLRKTVQTIYNPIPFDDLRQKALAPAPHPWLDDDIPVLAAVGRMTPQKGFDTLLQAMAALDSHPRLIILGEGPLRDALERMVDDLGLRERVALPGFVDNPYPILARAAAFVSSSRWEGLPTVLLEALALDVPIVATDCPTGPREILEDGRLGVLVPPDNPAALAQAIAQTLAGDGPSGSFDESQYRTEAVVERYLRVFER